MTTFFSMARKRVTVRKAVKIALILALTQHGSHVIVKDKDKHIESRQYRKSRRHDLSLIRPV